MQLPQQFKVMCEHRLQPAIEPPACLETRSGLNASLN